MSWGEWGTKAQPLQVSEIEAYYRMTKMPVSPNEVNTILELDDCYLGVMNG